ncbi:MAG: FAD-dependent oxidoreductase, partial [Chloroflexota bacterium]|nr:FAD-dependent oxidoreductase [Chloroflexota bacterium]
MVAIEADVVVAGGGMGGLTAACSAQEAGARTVLLEKAPRIGGSAAASGGTIWCATDLEGWLSVQPGGDPALGRALIASFFEGIHWLRRQGVDL